MSETRKPLGVELFELVEHSQGDAFIADDMGARTPHSEVIERAEVALYYTNVTAKKLRAFLRKHRRAGPGTTTQETDHG